MSKNKEFKPFKIPSIFGLHRGLVGVVFIVMFFILLGILPSFMHMGRRVHFSANIYPLQLDIDGSDMYLIPGDVYLKPGRHNIVVKYAGDVLKKDTVKVRPSLFYSWLIEGRKKIYIEINKNDINKEKVIYSFLEDASHYSTITEETASSPIRAIYSDLKTLIGDDGIKEYRSVIEEATRLIASSSLSEDAKKIGFQTNVPIFENGEIVDKKLYDFKFEDKLLSNKKVEYDNIIGIKPFDDSSIVFQANETTEYDWQLFLNENPYWNVSNIDELIDKNLVDEYYMKGFTGSASKVMVNVSPLAVNAYTEWLSKKIGIEVRLPSIDEYVVLSYYANEFDNSYTVSLKNDSKICSILGGVWEMTSTVFEPQYYASDNYTRGSFNEFKQRGIPLSIELFGGSSYNINRKDKDLRSLRGVMLPSVTGDAIGFRVCWEIDK